MLEVKGLNIDKSPFEDLELVSEILSFDDNPVLIHYRDKRKQDLIAYWVDFDTTGNRWFFAKVTKQELFDYLKGIKSLKQLFSEINAEYIFLIDKNLQDEDFAVKLISKYLLPEKYLPKDESFFHLGLSDLYTQYLTEFDYLHKLRENSYIFKAEPSNRIHQTTLGAKQAAIVLNAATNSMEGYIEVTTFNLLKDQFADVSKINRRINKMKNRLSPRVANANFSSFEVWLAMDVMMIEGEDDIDTQIRKHIVEGYKNDVLDVDYTSDADAKSISEKYNEDQRNLIFKPLVSLFENDEFDISIFDHSRTIRRTTNKIKLKSTVKDIIFPKPTLQQLEEDINKKNKIYSFVISLKEGEDFSKVRKKELLDNLIFKQEVAETPHDIESPIEANGKKVILKKPLRCILQVDVDGNFRLYNSVLELMADGNDFIEVRKDIKSQFISLIDKLESNPNWVDSKADELRKFV